MFACCMTPTFAYYKGSDYFLGGSKFKNFAIFFRCRGFVNYLYGYTNLSRFSFVGVCHFPQVVFGVPVKKCLLYHVSFI